MAPARYQFEVVVCWNGEDKATGTVLNWYSSVLPKNHTFFNMPMPITELGRRCIGRDRGAMLGEAPDFTWFTDVDHCFYDGIFDNIVDYDWPDDVVMIFPETLMIHKDHKTGDIATKEVMQTEPKLCFLKINEFVPKLYHRAIGGVQIVKGEFAHQYGYLHEHPRWQKPCEIPFADFRDDVKYRNFCSSYGKIKRITLPGVYRIRHTHTSYQ